MDRDPIGRPRRVAAARADPRRHVLLAGGPRRRSPTAGYRGFWMGYFAGRAAPLGAVGPEVVGALFYNFAPCARRQGAARRLGLRPTRRRRWMPAAPDPSPHCGGRFGGRRRRHRPSSDGRGAGRPGRPVGAAGRPRRCSPPTPPSLADRPARRALWHAATLLREHRGDGHVAPLTASGICGPRVNVLPGRRRQRDAGDAGAARTTTTPSGEPLADAARRPRAC